ncbi:MAG: WS/DGAT domain-containing protein [Actinobacteria bacterium]|nr:WS/DGAT domain-containing protein [Actinomycetota bacterium]
MRLGDRHRPVMNLIVSNVPGPPIPLYSAGARVEAIYPMGPLLPGAGINITILSNMGSVDFGIIADRETVPEVWRLSEGLSEGIDVLLAAARKPRKKAAVRKRKAPGKRAPAERPAARA